MSNLAAPFPYFGGKSKAAEDVWAAFGDVQNYVEPFFGSGAVLLNAPDGSRIETVNDKDGFVANFWRAIIKDAAAVAARADWPVNEADLFARHSWLVRQRDLAEKLHDPDFYDAKIAGWWAWGACAWIGSGWCGGNGPWVWDGKKIVDRRQLPHLGDGGQGINRKLPHLGDGGHGINRQLPHLGGGGQGINRKLPHLGDGARSEFIYDWFSRLQHRLRDVRVACGDWSRVVGDSVTTKNGLTAVFLDPPYTNGNMNYAAGGVGGALADDVRAWCVDAGNNKLLRIVLCGHAGEHDELLRHGWIARQWAAGGGYGRTDEAVANRKSETLWCSPHCVPKIIVQRDLFAEAAE
jgi:DNA adenine methylase